jgi:hypothetical protein
MSTILLAHHKSQPLHTTLHMLLLSKVSRVCEGFVRCGEPDGV